MLYIFVYTLYIIYTYVYIHYISYIYIHVCVHVCARICECVCVCVYTCNIYIFIYRYGMYIQDVSAMWAWVLIYWVQRLHLTILRSFSIARVNFKSELSSSCKNRGPLGPVVNEGAHSAASVLTLGLLADSQCRSRDRSQRFSLWLLQCPFSASKFSANMGNILGSHGCTICTSSSVTSGVDDRVSSLKDRTLVRSFEEKELCDEQASGLPGPVNEPT